MGICLGMNGYYKLILLLEKRYKSLALFGQDLVYCVQSEYQFICSPLPVDLGRLSKAAMVPEEPNQPTPNLGAKFMTTRDGG